MTAPAPVTGDRCGEIRFDPDDPTTLRLRGDVDRDTLGRFCALLGGDRELEGALGALAAAGVRTLDVSGVTFADSALANLVCAVHATAPGRVRVRGADPRLRRLLELTGTGSLVDLRG